jgi:plastocyanin
MRTWVILIAVLLASSLVPIQPAFSEDSAVVTDFIAAYKANDRDAMRAVVEKNSEKIPAEIKTIIYKTMSPNTPAEEKDPLLYAAELMGIEYNELTGDFEPLKEVKRVQFEKQLTKPVRSVAKDGVHIVRSPLGTADHFNYFEPDNIIIKAGEKVRWVNEDKIGHLFASFSIIGKGGLFTPNIAPNESWEYTFIEPGEYFYLCFIHKGMIGKVTVE